MRAITVEDFKNAPQKLKGEYSEIFYRLSDRYDRILERENEKVLEPEDIKKIIEISAGPGTEEKMAKAINKLSDKAKEVLIIGRPKHGKPKYIIILGPISDREYFEYFA